ncbi:MAG TPA: maleylpyruvate isomerase N-terminal domain-containing protein [Actinomycetota bacterium]|jgi:uncharacterized protein (TIGR03083 family)
MSSGFVDQKEACAAGERVTTSYVGLLRAARNPGKTAIGEWSVGDAATHTAQVFEMYAQAATGDASFPVTSSGTLNEYWAGRLRDEPERDPAGAADRIEAAATTIWPAYGAMSGDEIVEWYGGVKVPAYTPPSIIVTEALVHGYDIAHAEDLPWTLDSDIARISVRGLFPLLPQYVNEAAARDVSITYELSLRGGPLAYFTFADGALSVGHAAPGPVDCKLSVDPATYLLVGYGRIGQWGPTLTGKVVAYGRKPWLGLKLGKLIATP